MKRVSLSSTYYPNRYALVDDDMFESLSRYKWFLLVRQGTSNKELIHAYRVGDASKGERTAVYMHQQIMGPLPPGKSEIDHIDGNGLNNQRHNLRFATRSENTANAPRRITNVTGYKGVQKAPITNNRWYAHITVNYKAMYLGSFCRSELAALAYDVMAEQYFGQFAYLNFPSLPA